MLTSTPAHHLVVIDCETTGLGSHDRIVEIAALTLDPRTWEPTDEYETLLNPERDVGRVSIHGITASMVEAAPTFPEIVTALASRLHGATLIAHNLPFDARMLGYEFERLGVDFDADVGLCTFGATGSKLIAACRRHGITLSNQHRALADARATAALARKIFDDAKTNLGAATIGRCTQLHNPRTLCRDIVDAGTSEMVRVVSLAYYPYSDEASLQYLYALDCVLDDHHIDRQEQADMERLAAALGISSERCQEVHGSYLASIISAVQRDGIVTESEQQIIRQVADALGISDITIPEVTELAATSSLREGMHVCFTGEAVIEGVNVSRDYLEKHAASAGMQPVASVSKKNCDLLVAADSSSRSAKARKARVYGIPVMTATDFLVEIGRGA